MLQQKLLTVMGDDCGIVPDGVFGPTTKAVMAKFMAKEGLTTGPGDSVSQLTPAAGAVLRDKFMSELEAKALRDASTAATDRGDYVDPDQDVKMLQRKRRAASNRRPLSRTPRPPPALQHPGAD